MKLHHSHFRSFLFLKCVDHSLSLLRTLSLHSSTQLHDWQSFSSSSTSLKREPVPHADTQKDLEFFSKTQVASPARIQKLISSQSDPLLAKEIFDLASRQPNFHHSYATFYTLILKLGHARQFSLVDDLLLELKRLRYTTTPALFSRLIRIYGDADLPDKALKTFYNIIEFNCQPTSKHLNLVLAILVANRSFLRPAFDLFRTAHKYGVDPNVDSYNIVMRAFCYNGELSVAYKLFNQMFKREVLPDVESYRILMQALCRKSQVTAAVDLLEDMLNKGFVPDALSYTSLLNSLCRKKKLREAYKLLCRMKVKGCNPNITHYNTVISGLCREGCASDAIMVLNDMHSNGCLPNLVSYTILLGGLVDRGLYDEAIKYMEEMMSKGFSLHFSVSYLLIKGLCNVGRVEEASRVLEGLLKHGNELHVGTWKEVIPRIFQAEEMDRLSNLLDEVIKVEVAPHTRIIDAGVALENYLKKKMLTSSWKA